MRFGETGDNDVSRLRGKLLPLLTAATVIPALSIDHRLR